MVVSPKASLKSLYGGGGGVGDERTPDFEVRPNLFPKYVLTFRKKSRNLIAEKNGLRLIDLQPKDSSKKFWGRPTF